METSSKHVITALVSNEPGVLAHVAGMFAARGFNIDSLVVGRTEKADVSRMTIVVVADDQTFEQVRKHLAAGRQGYVVYPLIDPSDDSSLKAATDEADRLQREVFPEFKAQLISVTVPYRGAAPAEVEQAVCIRIEEAIQGLEGIKRIQSAS